MSVTALLWASRLLGRWPEAVGLPAKMVLFALANRHNQETGRCDPSVLTLAEDAGLSERAVRQGLRDLEVAGLIATVRRTLRTGRGQRNLNNRYRLVGLRGGAQYAGGVGHNMPTNLSLHPATVAGPRPAAFDDIVMLIEDAPEEGPDQGLDTHAPPSAGRSLKVTQSLVRTSNERRKAL